MPFNEPREAVPRIDHGPYVADQCRCEGEAHPADHPDHGRRDILERALISNQACDHHECKERNTHHSDSQNDPSGDHAATRKCKPQSAVSGAACGHESGNHEERKSDGRTGAEDIEPERNRQIVALAEPMRMER